MSEIDHKSPSNVKKILLNTPNFKGTFRLCVIGSTGSGKTSFLKMLLGSLFSPTGDVKRRHEAEKKVGSTYTIVDKSLVDESSTTTVSVNVSDILLVLTTSNTIEWLSPRDASDLDFRDDIDSIWHIIWNDTAGQERFDFMPQMTIPGSDAIILFADGTNMESIVKLSFYLNLIKEEEQNKGKTVPIVILLNKSDMKDRGFFLGIETAKSIMDSSLADKFVFETSVKERYNFEEPIRMIIDTLKPRSRA
ncbi:MAG: hypothetical protein ACTSP4_02215, partial [Candidatus Hodarchaeales archaeon]